MAAKFSWTSLPANINTWLAAVAGVIALITPMAAWLGDIAKKQDRLDENTQILNVGSVCKANALPIPIADDPAWRRYAQCVFDGRDKGNFWQVSNSTGRECAVSPRSVASSRGRRRASWIAGFRRPRSARKILPRRSEPGASPGVPGDRRRAPPHCALLH
jgi:hypothetical protein